MTKSCKWIVVCEEASQLSNVTNTIGPVGISRTCGDLGATSIRRTFYLLADQKAFLMVSSSQPKLA